MSLLCSKALLANEYDVEETNDLFHAIKQNLALKTEQFNFQLNSILQSTDNRKTMEYCVIEYQKAMTLHEYHYRCLILKSRSCDTLFEGLEIIKYAKKCLQIEQKISKLQLSKSQKQLHSENVAEKLREETKILENVIIELRMELSSIATTMAPTNISSTAEMNADVWHKWWTSVDQNALLLSTEYSIHEYKHNNTLALKSSEFKTKDSMQLKDELNCAMRKLSLLLNQSLKSRTPHLHKIHLYLLSNFYYQYFENNDGNQNGKYAKRIMQKMYENIEYLLLKWQENELKSNEMGFLLFLLCWKFPQMYYPLIVRIANQLLNIYGMCMYTLFVRFLHWILFKKQNKK